MLLVLLYVSAAIAANLLANAFGPVATIPIAFGLIGLNLTSRDRLHDRWHNDRLALRMGALIAVSGVLSVVINPTSRRIAVASFVAFVASESVDALAYQLLHRHPW